MAATERIFPMPDLGEGLEDGEIVAWLVAEGDAVVLNQGLVEIETAKASVEIPSPVGGTIVALHGGVGDTVPVGAPLVTFGVAADDGASAAGPAPAAASGSGGPVRATPPVRALAKELGIDLTTVAGSGPSGRVTADDVRAAASGATPAGGPTVATEPGSASRAVVATMLERQAAIPQVTTFRTLDCGALESFRRELGVSPLPVVIAALCRSIAGHPALNAAWHDHAVVHRDVVHVGLAVDAERGLVVPVIHDAGPRGIAELAAEVARLAGSARDGSLGPEDLRGATIAVSNTGSYGSEAGTPILSPGTSVTLAVGAIAPRPLVFDGQVVARPACTLSCTFDHRVLDGAAVGRALSDLVERLGSAEGLGDLAR